MWRKCSTMISLGLIFVTSLSLCASDERVKFAAVIFRHGDRTPVDLYPTDPWRNESLWPVRFGQLTNIGKMQHYKFGQWLRNRYSHLLSEEYDPTEIYVRSTDVDRTLMSAQANLAGMYPPKGRSTWNSELMWQPIPIHTVPEHEDELLAMKKPCPAYTQLHKELTSSSAYKERLNKYQVLMDYLSVYTGFLVKTYFDIDSIYSVLNIEQLYNFTLPDWTKDVFPDKMEEPACYSFKVDTFNTQLSRLKIGPMLKEITTKMMDVVSVKDDEEEHKKNLKVMVLSGHDYTVGSLLNALGVFDNKCPVYTSTVFMELLFDNKTDTHFVMISYKNSTEIIEPYVLRIPYCGQLCPIQKFISLYENLISVDWETDCEVKVSAMLLYLTVSVSFVIFIIYVGQKVAFIHIYNRSFP